MRTVDGMTDTWRRRDQRSSQSSAATVNSGNSLHSKISSVPKGISSQNSSSSFSRTSGSPQIPHLLPLHLQTVSAHKTHYNSEYESSAQIPRYGHDSELLPHYRACLCDAAGVPTKIRRSVSLVSSAICRSSSHALSRRHLWRKRS